jgi:hypothetical protein
MIRFVFTEEARAALESERGPMAGDVQLAGRYLTGLFPIEGDLLSDDRLSPNLMFAVVKHSVLSDAA